MDEVLRKRFVGQARLVRLLLWRIGNSTDLATCFCAAKQGGMLGDDDVRLLGELLGAEEACRANDAVPIEVDEVLVAKLQRYADKLNRADSA
ncbi:hypothetical protein [Xiamenia xianingshaonis]|uniref:Uncharacterized protein n=1 Tax=Xiamenia xianingshaonis TaxID=2682776 RepID=A0A9E6SUI2_9ACTN|nr:hypothetical protein [Xiamenia xianingshaonis]NHM13466.1 hypothetical protein [Xiamenia xianingshaonis]QTU84459.1 hypothetical protein J7S26_00540 [Xiamenia xianingshaonis]